MKMLKTIIVFALLISSLPLFAQDTGTNAAPPIPEEAHEHFVKGATIFKVAKSVNDFSQAASEFSQAAELAPSWPDPRYDLALTKEAAGDYSGAIADLKIYQQFKLSDDEARTAQDKIYAIEAKQQLKQTQDAKAAQDKIDAAKKNLDGAKWRYDFSSASGDCAGYVEAVCSGNTLVASLVYTRFDVTPMLVGVGKSTVDWKITFEGGLEGKTFTVSNPNTDQFGSSTVSMSDDGKTITFTFPAGASISPQVYTRE